MMMKMFISDFLYVFVRFNYTPIVTDDA